MEVCKRYDSMGVRELGAPFEAQGKRDRVWATEEIERSWRAHGGNYKRTVPWKYPMCQLLC
jgi:hypothetical protein